MMQVRHLCKSFGGNVAVHDVSFTVHAGEMLALIGPNGAGKSTCFNMLTGQLATDSGTVILRDKNITGLKPHRIAALGLACTFQIAATFTSMTVLENIQIAMAAHQRRIFSFWSPLSAQYREPAMALLQQLEMAHLAEQSCAFLAYGDIKRLELGIALASEPAVLLMDEPTAGMATAERRSLMRLVKTLVQQRDMAVLFTEHSMDVVFECADRVMVMARGTKLTEGTVAQVRENPLVQQVYFGSGAVLSGQQAGVL